MVLDASNVDLYLQIRGHAASAADTGANSAGTKPLSQRERAICYRAILPVLQMNFPFQFRTNAKLQTNVNCVGTLDDREGSAPIPANQLTGRMRR